MSKLINRVEDLLLHGYKTASPQTLRDSDRALLLAVWDQEGLHLTDEQKRAYMSSTTAETITRARRALKAKYPASAGVDQARYDRFKQYKYETALML
jgi:hypothetical protein